MATEAASYMIVVGGGKVGRNLTRELVSQGNEVTLIENDRGRYLALEQEFGAAATYGDATELWVLDRAGIERATLVIAVTGDDEDNILICQVAKEKYEVADTIARVNYPANREWFELLGIRPYVSATDLILRMVEHSVPKHGIIQLLDLGDQGLEVVELELQEGSSGEGKRVGDLSMPEGSLLISVLRAKKGFVPGPDTVLEAGDEILAVLDPGKEAELQSLFSA